MQKVQLEIKNGLEKLNGGSQPSFSDDAVVGGGEKVFSRLVRLKDPVIKTQDGDEIAIIGNIYMMSVAEMLKRLKNNYKTQGVNEFPLIVNKILFERSTQGLSRVGDIDLAKASNDLGNARRIITGYEDLESVVFVRSFDPIEPVEEYSENGYHKSGNGAVLRAIKPPFAVMTSTGAKFELEPGSEVIFSDKRKEEQAVLSLNLMELYAKGVSNKTQQTTGGEKNKELGIALAAIAALSIGIGIGGLISRKLVFLAILLPIGAILAYLRFRSNWGKEIFGYEDVKVVGDAPILCEFLGKLS